MKWYTGIGSRDTPSDICLMMSSISIYLNKYKYILRSGGAAGADKAFEDTLLTDIEIYLPWKSFNGSGSEFYLDNITKDTRDDAYKIAKMFYHSNLDSALENTRKFMTRNTFQIFGQKVGELDEISKFVICWTKDGKDSGGTGQALKIARHYNVPVYNLKNKEDKADLSNLLLEIKYNGCS